MLCWRSVAGTNNNTYEYKYIYNALRFSQPNVDGVRQQTKARFISAACLNRMCAMVRQNTTKKIRANTKQMRNTIYITKHRLQPDILKATAHNSQLTMCWCWTQNTLRIKYLANLAVIENAMKCLTNERFTRISELKSNKIVALVNSKFITIQSIWFSCNLLARKSTQIVIDSLFLFWWHANQKTIVFNSDFCFVFYCNDSM